MPRSSASPRRREARPARRRPGSRRRSAGCTPDRILISVDLPAPLSPSRQWTSPGSTAIDTSCSAITLPKYLSTFAKLDQRRGHHRLRVARLQHEAVEEHGDDQHRAHEQLEPVGVDAGVEDAHLDEAEDEGAEHARRSPSRSRRSSSVPPITTAMIASNSFCVPRSVSAEPAVSTWIVAKMRGGAPRSG